MSSELPNFDELLKLAQENPEELEALRKRLCDNLIQNAPQKYRRRLRGLQFQIDMERQKAKTPMAACLKISAMMHESFRSLRDALNEAQGIQAGNLTAINRSKPANPPVAKVLEFPAN